jgi:hypothetical protein
MQQFLLIALVILGGASYWLYTENQTLKENNLKLEVAIQQQEEAMAAIRESYELQGQSLLTLQSRNAQIETEMNSYLDIFKRHNLDKLAQAKPGLITTRVNKGTKQVFETIENDSKELENLNTN